MRTRPRFSPSRSALLLTTLGFGLLCAGCVTTSNPWAHIPGKDGPLPGSDPKPAVFPTGASVSAGPVALACGQEVAWVLENAPADPKVIRQGRSQIGPDGTMVVGPYGTAKVVGLAPAQAAKKVETLLRSHFKNPRVRVQSLETGLADTHVTWRKGNGFGDVVRASNDEGPLLPEPELKPPAPDLKFDPPLPGEIKPEGPHGPPLGPPLGPFISDAGLPGHKVHWKRPPHRAFPVYPGVPSEMNPTLLPPYVIGPPDVLLIQSRHALVTHPIQGQHLIRPDGTIGLSIYGSPVVAGLTLEQAKEVIASTINPKLKLPKDVDEKTGKVSSYYDREEQLKVIREGLVVDVLAYNSKVYYVITDGGGYGEQVVRVPITGSETVLDAISQVNGLSPVSSKHHVWIARRNPGHGSPDNVLKVDWIGVTQRGAMATNYQIMPGDRLYVRADRWRTADAIVAKIIAPFERLLGVTLLGSQTVNSIRSGSSTTNR